MNSKQCLISPNASPDERRTLDNKLKPHIKRHFTLSEYPPLRLTSIPPWSPQHYQIRWSEICVRFPSCGAAILFFLICLFLFRKVSSCFSCCCCCFIRCMLLVMVIVLHTTRIQLWLADVLPNDRIDVSA